MLRSIGLAIGFFVYSVALRSSATEKTQVRLVYVRSAGTKGCPQQMQLRMAVAARLGYDPFSATAPRTVIAQIDGNVGELKGHVELIDDENVSQGARQLTAPLDRCAELVRAMALSISIAIDPESALVERNETGPREANANPEPTRTQRAALTPKSEEAAPVEVEHGAPPTPIRFFSGAGLHVTNGAGPSSAFGAAWFVGGRYGRFSLALEPRVDGRASKDVGDGSVHVSFLLGSLVPCLHLGYATLCGTGTFGSVRASASGLVRVASSSGNYTALGGRLGWEMPLVGRLWGGIHADVFAPWHPLSLKTHENATLWTAPSVGTLLGFRLSARFE